MLRHFFNDFMTFVPLQLPQLLDVTTMEEAQFLDLELHSKSGTFKYKKNKDDLLMNFL